MRPHGTGQLAHNVPRCMDPIGWERRIGRLARPHRKAVVELRSENHIARAGVLKYFGPRVGIPLGALPVEDRNEVVVVEFCPVVLAMIGLRGRPVDLHHVGIPLGIRVVADKVGRVEVMIRVRQRRPSWHGIGSPAHKYPKLRPRIPPWQWMLIQRSNRRLVLDRRLRAAPTANQHAQSGPEQPPANHLRPAPQFPCVLRLQQFSSNGRVHLTARTLRV